MELCLCMCSKCFSVHVLTRVETMDLIVVYSFMGLRMIVVPLLNKHHIGVLLCKMFTLTR